MAKTEQQAARSKKQEARSEKREARSEQRAASNVLTGAADCPCLLITAITSKTAATTMATGEASTNIRATRSAASLYPVETKQNKTKQNKTKQPVLTRSAAREGPHGHLPQAVLRGAERLAAPGPRATTRRNSHSRSGHRHRHLGDRHGRVSWALHSASRNLQREVCEANRVCSKFLNAEVR